ncbi:MAG TPA: type II toxin-antitoxin system Phd/YefM family antitoxin [bacterium]|nr:type II toxin-antitoxin system Phd/YefM family antitoxin [bacterium]
MSRKVLDTNAVRDRLGEILDEAHYQGNEFVIQRRGKPLAVIIPYARYEQMEQRREAAFRVFHEIWEANKDVDPNEVAEVVEQEVEKMRAERRRQRTRR